MFKLEGVYVAMLTPFDTDGGVDEGVLRALVDFYVETGVDGLFPVSSVGEFPHLEPGEASRVAEVVCEQARGRVAVTPGASSTCARNSIRLARHAAAAGCQAVVVCPPYYYPVSQEAIVAHYLAIQEAVEIPIVVYNIPLFTTGIGYEAIARLSREPHIVGMKDSSGNMVDFMHFLNRVEENGGEFAVLTGREETFLAALAVGAAGSMTGTAAVVPELLVQVYRLYQAGRWEDALAVQRDIVGLVRAMTMAPFPLGFKAGLEMRGFPMGSPRQALAAAEATQLEEAKAVIAAALGRVKAKYGLPLREK